MPAGIQKRELMAARRASLHQLHHLAKTLDGNPLVLHPNAVRELVLRSELGPESFLTRANTLSRHWLPRRMMGEPLRLVVYSEADRDHLVAAVDADSATVMNITFLAQILTSGGTVSKIVLVRARQQVEPDWRPEWMPLQLVCGYRKPQGARGDKFLGAIEAPWAHAATDEIASYPPLWEQAQARAQQYGIAWETVDYIEVRGPGLPTRRYSPPALQ